MRILHSHDPVPDDDRVLTNEEIGSDISRAHERMWEFASLGEFQLAQVCEHARDRMLDRLSTRLTEEVV